VVPPEAETTTAEGSARDSEPPADANGGGILAVSGHPLKEAVRALSKAGGYRVAATRSVPGSGGVRHRHRYRTLRRNRSPAQRPRRAHYERRPDRRLSCEHPFGERVVGERRFGERALDGQLLGQRFCWRLCFGVA